MGFLWFGQERGRESANSSTGGTLTLADLESAYDLIEVNDEPGRQFAIVTPKAKAAVGIGQEYGSSSPSPWTSFTRQEYNPALQGEKGFVVYDKMRKSDGTVRGTLRSIKIGALSGRWFMNPASNSPQDLKVADWCWRNLTEMMSISWTQVLIESLLMCDFGYYMFEKVWENQIVDGELRTVLTKLAPRHPMDVKDWLFDTNGGPQTVLMYPSQITSEVQEIPIDIAKLLVFTFDREAGNIEGISVLRSAYKHWYFLEQLYKIDAIQKERHGIGIPVIKLPIGFTPEDKAIAENLGRNIRTNERAHIVLPPGWDIMMLKMEGQPVNALESVAIHQAAIRENILVNFIIEGAREDDLVMFFRAARFVADIVADTFTQYLVPQMVSYNFPGVTRYPRLQVRRIGETADWRTLSFAIRNLIGAGVIVPDEPLEDNIREEMDLPKADPATARLVATPQNPFDVNEELLQQDGVDPSTDPLDPSNDQPDDGSQGQDTHNTNNPNYNRGVKKRSRIRQAARKQSGAQVGLPRQSVPGRQRSAFGLPGRQGGNDRSGG